MAKAAKTAIKTKDQKAAAEAKNWTKVIKAVRSPKSGAYTFKESIIHKDKIKEYPVSYTHLTLPTILRV